MTNCHLSRSEFKPTIVPGLLSLGLILVFTIGCGSGKSSETTPPGNSGNNFQTVTLTRLSQDTFTNSTSQHATEVEPGLFAFGSTMVSAFQVARIFSGGGADIGFATSTDAGTTWSSGYLPGITTFQGGGLFSAASDSVVAFDAAHNVWMISSLAIGVTTDVVVNRSPDGINWGNPIVVSSQGSPDKNWIACDDAPGSPFYGHCYVEWDDPSNQDVIEMNTSSDGGLTWGPALNTANLAQGIGGVPLVQPNGTVVVPILGIFGNTESITAFTSTDGGGTWNAPVTISPVTDHQVAGNLRTAALPSAQMDSLGRIYVIWQDCRFRTNCASNDLVLSASADGMTWTAPARVPIDATTSTVDHFIPGLGVDPLTSGTGAHLTLTYYFYPISNCTTACSLGVGYVSSQDGGQTWSASTQLVGGMSVNWLPNTFSGLMVADYISTSYINGKAFGVFAVANPPTGSVFNEAIYTTPAPLVAEKSGIRFSSKRESPVPNAKSDHGPRRFYDEDHEYPIPPVKRDLQRSAKR